MGAPDGSGPDAVSLNDDLSFTALLSGIQCKCLLDTGSSISVLHKAVFDTLPHAKLCPTATQAKTASQSPLPLLGRTVVSVQLGRVCRAVPLYVSESTEVPCILGVDFLRHFQPCVIDLRRKCLEVSVSESVKTVSAEITSVGNVVVGKNVTVPPGCEMIIPGFVHNCDFEGQAIVEPICERPGLEVVRSVVAVAGSSVPVIVRNVSSNFLTVPKHDVLANLDVEFSEEQQCGDTVESREPVDFDKLVDLQHSNLTASQRRAFFQVLQKYEPMFDGHIGLTDVVMHSIDTGDHPPIRQNHRRIPPNLHETVKAQLDELVRQGILEKSDSGWSSPICLVRKKSGEVRICADLRKLNAVTRLPAYPVPRIDDTLEALAGSSLFCVLDMNSAYHQIPIKPEDRDKATITTPFSNYRYTRVCFGLSSAPFTCAKMLDAVLGDLRPQTCVNYFDDIIVHGAAFSDVLEKLDAVLSRLSSAGLTLNLAKCKFFRDQVTFLGHVVSRDGLCPDPEKVALIRDWPEPRTAKELTSFLGLASFCRKYVKNFSEIAAPLFDISSSDTFQWSDQAQAAFDRLKVTLSSAPVVALPRFGADAGSFTLDCDASDEGVGAVLMQEQDGVDRIIAFGSQRLSKSQRNYSTTKKELLACVVFVQHFSHYLQGKRFKLRTDHSSLQWLMNFRNPSGMLARWLDILGSFTFDIVYRPGSENVIADALSRRPCEVADAGSQTEEFQTSSCDRITCTDWSLSYIQAEQMKDEGIANITRHLSAGCRPARREVPRSAWPLLRQWPRLRLIEGVLFRAFKRRPRSEERLQVVIPSHLISGVLTSLHAGSAGGHFSREKLLAQVQLRFWWPSAAADVNRYCQHCERCTSRNNPIPQPCAPMGELRSCEPWETVSSDFLTNLPTTARGNKHLLVCCDHFTRFCDVFPVPDMSATTVATTLVEGLFSRFGCPKYLHSDCAANFRSQLLSEVCRLMGITKTNTSSVHPQGDGKCERMMRTIVGMLSKYLDANHDEWDVHLPLLMMGYRAQVHQSLGYSPFFLMFGREPRLPIDAEIDVPRVHRSDSIAAYVDRLCSGLRRAYRFAIHRSDQSNARNKQLYERRLNEFAYQPGDPVFLLNRVPRKGEYYKFVRPWKAATVQAKVGDLNYRIRVEDSGKLLLVHHNRLKPRSLHRSLVASDHGSEDVDGRGSVASAAPAALRGLESVGDPPQRNVSRSRDSHEAENGEPSVVGPVPRERLNEHGEEDVGEQIGAHDEPVYPAVSVGVSEHVRPAVEHVANRPTGSGGEPSREHVRPAVEHVAPPGSGGEPVYPSVSVEVSDPVRPPVAEVPADHVPGADVVPGTGDPPNESMGVEGMRMTSDGSMGVEGLRTTPVGTPAAELREPRRSKRLRKSPDRYGFSSVMRLVHFEPNGV